MEKLKRPVPAYLRLLFEEYQSRARPLQRAVFAMSCFWTGEARLGEAPGVIATQAGFLDGHEVVEVEFDPAVVSYAELLKNARQMQCATRVYCRNGEQLNSAAKLAGSNAVRSSDAVRPDAEPKYHLSRTPLKYVPMTSVQACRVNAALGQGRDPQPLLSPRQLALLEVINAHPDDGWSNAIGARDLVDAWRVAQRKSRTLGNGEIR
jgi:hypothetical protein